MTGNWLVRIEASTPGGGRSGEVELLVPAPSAAEALLVGFEVWKRTGGDPQLEGPQTIQTQVRPRPGPRVQTVRSGSAADRLVEDQLLCELFYDALTGLPRREVFLDHLRDSLRGLSLGGSAPALVLCDIDDFRWVHSEFGEEATDEVIVVVAGRIAEMLRWGDNVARIGGDQFAVLLEDVPLHVATAVAARMMQRVSEPIPVGGRELVLTASAGVVMAEAGTDADDLLTDAGIALGRAKQGGGASCEVFGHPPNGNADPDCADGAGVSDAMTRVAWNLRPSPGPVAHVRILQRAAEAANECATLEEAARVVLQQVCSHTGWPLGHLYVIPAPDGDRGGLHVWHNRSPGRYRRLQQRVESLHGQPATGIPGDASLARGIVGAFSCPVLVGQETVGLLEFFSDEASEISASLHDVLTTLGIQLGRAAERERPGTRTAGWRTRRPSAAGTLTPSPASSDLVG